MQNWESKFVEVCSPFILSKKYFRTIFKSFRYYPIITRMSVHFFVQTVNLQRSMQDFIQIIIPN